MHAKRIALVAALAALLLPASAGAHGRLTYLTLARGRVAIERFEQHTRGTVGACHTEGRTRVVCAVTEPAEEQEEAGWTQSTELAATLNVRRQTIRIELGGWAPGVIGGEHL